MDGLSFPQDADFDSFETILPTGAPMAETLLSRALPGILFVEDFDRRDAPPAAAEAEPEIIDPVLTEADISAARAQGHAEGLEAARGEHEAVQAQLCAAAMSAIADALAATRADAEAVAARVASEAAAAMLALLHAALPAVAEALAGQEVSALLAAVLPALQREPAVEVRLHPDILARVAAELPHDTAARLTLAGDAAMARGDALVTWRDGEMRRDMGAFWNDVSLALGEYALPDAAAILKGCNNGQ
jgi:flagellar biosynthesis/type III secretory pathway protein FliH